MRERIEARIEYLKERDITVSTNKEIQFLQSLLIKEGIGIEGSGKKIEVSLKDDYGSVLVYIKDVTSGLQYAIVRITKDGVCKMKHTHRTNILPLIEGKVKVY